MRAYIDGILSTHQDVFIPEDLWFATEDCDDNTVVSEDCICLSGLTCESSVNDGEFSCRWKGVEVTYIDDTGKEVETEDFTVGEFFEMIENKSMRLVNASAYFDTDVDVRITEFVLVDGESEEEFDTSLIDEIEFIA